MAKSKFTGNHPNPHNPLETERKLIAKISETGKEQLKKRRKAGLSSFYAQGGKIIEVLPNNSEHVRDTIKSKWVTLKKEKRSIKLK